MCCRSCVTFHRLFPGDTNAPRGIARQISSQPNLPLRIEIRGAFRAHPGGEPFVEPQIVPPGHRHKIAEPLMRHLVREHFVDVLLRLRRGIFRIK